MVDYHIPSILLRQAAGTACHDFMLCFVVTTDSKIFFKDITILTVLDIVSCVLPLYFYSIIHQMLN